MKTRNKKEIMVSVLKDGFYTRSYEKQDEISEKSISEGVDKSIEKIIFDTEPFVVKCMDEFAAQEKLQAEKVVLQEMANGWLQSEKEKEHSNDDNDGSICSVSPIMSIEELVDHLNFEVFRHRYPQISFSQNGESITVEVKE